jgi:predicted nucleic acid-binding protein
LKAVANCSVLISLSTIGQLDLLKKKFPQGVLVPRAVWNEVVTTGEGQPGAKEVVSATWITVQEVADRALVSLLFGDLDAGEAEAMFHLSREVYDGALRAVGEL